MDEKQIAIAKRQASEIRAGSVVRLKSGGPAMTVSEVKDALVSSVGIHVARCHWIDENGGGREYTFPVPTLIPF
jgi:uncharacterized protein YodC (DUF2158 family)